MSNRIPHAIGVAISPVPIIAVILMLSSKDALLNAVLFDVGWLFAIIATSVVALLCSAASPSRGRRGRDGHNRHPPAGSPGDRERHRGAGLMLPPLPAGKPSFFNKYHLKSNEPKTGHRYREVRLALKKNKTNVLIIIVDRQGAGALGCYGNTEHIARLPSYHRT